MKNLFRSNSMSRQARRRVDLAIAVAHERLLSAHIDHALDLVELLGDEVPFGNALEIYGRLLRLTDDEARIVRTRALATLGARVEGAGAPAEEAPEQTSEPSEPDEPAAKPRRPSLFGHLRQRMRGRVNEKLRHWTELEAARAEVTLLETHVQNALNFVEILTGELSTTDAVELYLDALDVRESIAEVVYYIALARLSERLLPARPQRPPSAQVIEAAEAAGAHDGEGRRLRVVERDGG